MFSTIFRIFSTKKSSYSRIDQLRYLSQSSLLEETVAPHMVRTTLSIVSIIFLALVFWAGVTSINEIAITEGEVIPIDHVQSVQHLQGGVVSTINVTEGQLVEKGQMLISLDSTGLQMDRASLEARKLFLQYQLLRLKSFINQKVPNFQEIGDERNSEMEKEQMNSFDSMIHAKETEREVLEQQINQKNEALNMLQKKKTTLAENIKLVAEERDLKKELMEKGRVSRFNYLDIQKQLNQIEGELNEAESDIIQAHNAIEEYKSRLDSLNAKFIDDAYNQLTQSDTDLEQVEEQIKKIDDEINHFDIKSPTYGYVKGLKVKTIGGVVEAGKVIIEIVPLEGTLIVETKIQPKDVGHIKVGQEVMVKVSSFEYSRYGSVKGKLKYLSATTFINEDGSRYYLGKISLEKNYVGKDPKENIIIPGMIVEADIVTGSKTILAYLLKPIRNSITTAFTER